MPAIAKEKPRPNLRLSENMTRSLGCVFPWPSAFLPWQFVRTFLLLRSMDLPAFRAVGDVLHVFRFQPVVGPIVHLFRKLSDTRWQAENPACRNTRCIRPWYGLFRACHKEHSSLLMAFWCLYGIYYAMTEGVEKAFVGDLAPSGSRATALGFFQYHCRHRTSA